MPTPFTSTFASAAAGSNGDGSGTRKDGGGGGTNEWSRSRVNGATQTFRRPSATTTPSQNRDIPQTTSTQSNGGVYIPPHLNPSHTSNTQRPGTSGDTRYSKDQLLGIFQTQKELGTLNHHLNALFSGTWNPLQNEAWTDINSKTEGKDAAPGPEVCWHHTVKSDPLGLQDMTEEEKEIFSTSVNSPIKPQTTNTKDGPSMGTAGGRKTSLSYSNTPGGPNRPGTRRRETLENLTTNGPLSPTESKTFFRTESNTATPPPALLRRRTDFKEEDISNKDNVIGSEDPTDLQSAFPSARKLTTGPLSAGINPPSASPWSAGPQSAGGFGSMGSFGSFAIGTPTSAHDSGEKRPGFGSARGSRFKDLLTKSSAEDMSSGARDKSNFGNFGALGKLAEDNQEGRTQRSQDASRNRTGRSETNPYDDTAAPAGSAALGGLQEGSAPDPGVEHFGFSVFAANAAPGSRDFGNPDSAIHQTPQGKYDLRDPTSPTNTNPYQSPAATRNDDDDQENTDSMPLAPGTAAFGSIRKNVFGADDRGPHPPAPQRSSSGFGGFPGFGGIGGPAWSSTGLGGGTPVRERALASGGFGDPIFSPLPDLQSPGAGLGSGFFGSGAFGSTRGTSRLGAMFPPAMQEQMRGDSRNEMQPASSDGRPGSAQATSIHDPFESTNRRRDDVFARGPNTFDDTLGHHVDDAAGAFGQITSGGQTGQSSAPVAAQRASGGDTAQSGHGLSQSSGSSSSNQMPTAQQRQMVMPDRMRWIYRDPQGNVQGPWSGLEMHDWFKAGFFTAELQVKKLEDAEYEPLAQLVRRIGNSREPFLVPQIGIPHGPPPNQGNHWASTTMSTGSAQPPFASSFPSFGTTLTAEQQNALERRKQEEQYLMARQKEHLAQQQALMKQMQVQNGPHGLHSLQHHASAHSLHSQPSFSSMTSPSGYQPSPMQGPIQPPQTSAGFNPPPTSFPSFGTEPRAGRDEELHNNMDRLSFNQRAGFPFSAGPVGPPGQDLGPSSLSAAQERVKLQQQPADTRSHQDTFLGPAGQNPRLEEFRILQGQPEGPSGRTGLDHSLPQPIGAPRSAEEPPNTIVAKPQQPIGHAITAPKSGNTAETEPLSLAQQIQRTAAANQHASIELETAAPPLSISPLPAPAAQRNRQHVADALAAESRSATQTPTEAVSISLAPWAERTAEIAKGPSLKEIQEAEAKRAAKQEEIASAARRAQAEQERLLQAQVPPPLPGLPVSSTWATNTTPTSATSPSASVWSKPAPGKSTGPTATTGTKKTLAQIQKEEESRKQKAAAAAASLQSSANNPAAVAGKRYAELASKIAPSTSPASPGTGAWTTVGSGGKAKTPAAVVATPQAAPRTVSTGAAPTIVAKTRPALQTSRSTNVPNQNKANDEFAKWIKVSLGKGLNSNINVDNFIQDLLQLPPEIEIISDSVYASSQTLDGRRFAEEFVRRRKLADKGIVEPASNGTTAMVVGGVTAGDKSGVGGGWSEVAKKGPTSAAGAAAGTAAGKDDAAAAATAGSPAFKVVSKKKGKR